ncbi:MAG: uroporphyrinogen decarboxylase family protein [Oceanipulchritudo sp.]
MNSRDRVKAAFEHKPHDRVPRHDTYWDDTIRRWSGEGLTGGREEALAVLGSDMQCVSPFPWPSPYPGRDETVSEDDKTRIFKDEWGATLRLFKDHQTTPEHLGWECDAPEAWQGGIRRKVLETESPLDLEQNQARYARACKEEKWTFFNTVEPFECLRKLIGDEETMIGIKEEPEWIIDMAEVTTTRSLQTAQSLYEAGIHPDGLWIYGDMAFNHATFCSPADYKELIWPQHKRMCDWAHERGMKTIYHTDGNVNGVIDLYIEAGIDVLQPLECKAGMDIRDLVPAYGDRLGFFGNIDVMKLIRGDLGEIEEEIKAKFAAGMSINGYLYHSDHSIPPQVSWELYREIARLVEKHGNYV